MIYPHFKGSFWTLCTILGGVELEPYPIWRYARAVKNNVKFVLNKHRIGMMLFLDDLPLQLGAYHQIGTNNIILNHTLIQIVEENKKSKQVINSFIYTLLLHEYLHSLGYINEAKVKTLVYEISKKCFGNRYLATKFAKFGPWHILDKLPLNIIKPSKRMIKIVKNFEKTKQDYII